MGGLNGTKIRGDNLIVGLISVLIFSCFFLSVNANEQKSSTSAEASNNETHSHHHHQEEKLYKVFRPFEYGFKSVSVVEGHLLKLYCEITKLNESEVTWSWTKDGQALDLDSLDTALDNDEVLSDHSVTIIEAQAKDAGDYECTARVKNESSICRLYHEKMQAEAEAMKSKANNADKGNHSIPNIVVTNLTDSQGERKENYSCTKDLFEKNKEASFKFKVRVKDPLSPILPLGIILGQCAILGLIMGMCHWREKRKEEMEKELPPEQYKEIHSDSDSE